MNSPSHQDYSVCYIAWLIGIYLVLTSATANALTLGEIDVHSKLNAPLNAVIPFSASKNELLNLSTNLASDEAFDRFGILPEDFHHSLRFEIIIDTTTYIKVTSSIAMREPLVEFVLSVYSGSGVVLKNFAAFLSP